MTWRGAADLASSAILALSLFVLAAAVIAHAPWVAAVAGALLVALYVAGLALLATRSRR